MNDKEGWEVVASSDLNFEEMTTEILFRGERVVQLSADLGFDNLQLKLFGGCSFDAELDLDLFMSLLLDAKDLLIQYDSI